MTQMQHFEYLSYECGTLLGCISNLEGADSIAGVGEHDSDQSQQPEGRGPRGDWLSLNRQKSEDALPADGHRHKVAQVGGDAELLKQGRQDRIDRFPAEHEHSGGSGVPEDHAEEKKNRSVSEAGEDDDPKVRLELAQSGTIEDVVAACGAEAGIHEREVGDERGTEQEHGADGTGRKFGQ